MNTSRFFNRIDALRLLGVLCGLGIIGSSLAAEPERGGAADARIWMTIGEHRFAVTLADTAAARAFAAQLPLALQMDELNGNEKKATLPKALPVNASRPGTLRNGDLMLYGTDTLVVFYVTFDSPYSYTRIGRLDDPSTLPRAVGSGNVRVRFSRN
jgi:hypothetical protein